MCWGYRRKWNKQKSLPWWSWHPSKTKENWRHLFYAKAILTHWLIFPCVAHGWLIDSRVPHRWGPLFNQHQFHRTVSSTKLMENCSFYYSNTLWIKWAFVGWAGNLATIHTSVSTRKYIPSSRQLTFRWTFGTELICKFRTAWTSL